MQGPKPYPQIENTTTSPFLCVILDLRSCVCWQRTKKTITKNLAQGITMPLKGHAAMVAVDQ